MISVPQITVTDFAESYIRKKGEVEARPILPTLHCGRFKKIHAAKLKQFLKICVLHQSYLNIHLLLVKLIHSSVRCDIIANISLILQNFQ